MKIKNKKIKNRQPDCLDSTKFKSHIRPTLWANRLHCYIGVRSKKKKVDI